MCSKHKNLIAMINHRWCIDIQGCPRETGKGFVLICQRFDIAWWSAASSKATWGSPGVNRRQLLPDFRNNHFAILWHLFGNFWNPHDVIRRGMRGITTVMPSVFQNRFPACSVYGEGTGSTKAFAFSGALLLCPRRFGMSHFRISHIWGQNSFRAS